MPRELPTHHHIYIHGKKIIETLVKESKSWNQHTAGTNVINMGIDKPSIITRNIEYKSMNTLAKLEVMKIMNAIFPVTYIMKGVLTQHLEKN